MAAEAAPYGRVTQKAPAVAEVHVVWITAGLGCDGDSVSITAATQPSIEDVILGAIPGLPKVHLHNPVLAYEDGDDFMKFWYLAEKGKLDPFVLVVEGSIPNENIRGEGYWAAIGTDPASGQPIKTTEWIDRLAPKALAVVAMRNVRNLRRHSRDGRQSYRLYGISRLSWLGLAFGGRTSDRKRPGLPGPTRQLYGNGSVPALSRAGLAPMIPLDDAGRPTWLFGRDRARRM